MATAASTGTITTSAAAATAETTLLSATGKALSTYGGLAWDGAGTLAVGAKDAVVGWNWSAAGHALVNGAPVHPELNM